MSFYNASDYLNRPPKPVIRDVTPFGPLIFKTHYNGWNWAKMEKVCEDFMNETEHRIHLETGDAGSTAPNYKKQPHIMPEFKDFYKFIEPIVSDILFSKLEAYTEHGYYVSNSWINYHGFGGQTETHHHGNAVLSIAAYINFPKDGGYIQFRDPLEYQKGFLLKNYDDEMFGWKTIEATTGDVILFPGWLRHRTQSNNNKTQKRWVLTTNYMSTYQPLKK